MINELKRDAEERMAKAVEAAVHAFNKIRTGRAHPVILEGVLVPYYGSDTPLTRMANISVLDARTLAVTPWEKNLVPQIEKAIQKADLGLMPMTVGEVIRIPMPALTEQTRKGFIRQARQEAETAKVAIRNIRRDVLSDAKEWQKEKMITEDEEHRLHEDIQKITDRFASKVDDALTAKEKDLLEI